MLRKLICLHREGIVLLPNELAEASSYSGNLLMVDWAAGNVFKRAIRCAKLLTVEHSVKVDVIPPLFGPVLVKVAAITKEARYDV